MLKTMLGYTRTVALFLSSSMKNELTRVDETQGLEDDSFRMAQKCTDEIGKTRILNLGFRGIGRERGESSNAK